MNIHISVPFLCTNNEQAEKTILFIVVNKKAGLLDPCYHETEVFFRNHVHLTNHLLWKEPHSLAQLVVRLQPLDKTSDQINGGNISPLPDGGGVEC
jgi:hypothetical protein